jgi:hypothetical protein
MFGFDKINLTFSLNPFFLTAGVALFILYSVYVYKYTVPAVSPFLRRLLAALRIAALILLLFLIFEPILTLVKKNILEPVNLVFVDNTKSIPYENGGKKQEEILKALNGLKGEGVFDFSELKLFGHKISALSKDSLTNIRYDESSTNFSKIFSEIKKDEQNIASITIISDGIITEGNNPVYTAEKLGIPVFTVGVGDTAAKNDIEIKNIIYNEFIYAENPTTILVSVGNKGFSGQNVSVLMTEDGNKIEEKIINLSSDGSQNVYFNYTPMTGGEKKISVSVSPLNGEYNQNNNKKVAYLNVLKNKIKIALIAGSPSPDLSFIKNTLEQDKNLSVSAITQISRNKYLENTNREKLLDSCQIIYLIGFPSAETSPEFLRRVKDEIENKNKSFFFVVSSSTDFNRLKELQNSLPFTIGKISGGFFEAQPEMKEEGAQSPIVQTNNPRANEIWNDLPPVYKPNTELNPRPESQTLSAIKVNNVSINTPLILSRRIGNKRAVAVLAKDIWKWKLQTSQKNLDVFDRFVLNGAKWLNAKETKKQVQIKTIKKIYAKNEPVEFTAQVFDESYNPVNNAKVNVEIKNNGEKFNITLNSAGDGLYDGSFQTTQPGDYSFAGNASVENKIFGSDAGKFNIGDIEIEYLETRTDADFLALLANQTKGRYFSPDKYKELASVLKQLKSDSAKEKIVTDEINLWSNTWIMALIILIFGTEWFLRKRAGML